MDSTEQIYAQVREHYSSASRTAAPKYAESVAKSFGYSEDELSNIPEDANLGLSCGNPLAITSLKEGETVIDLGSGAGFDIFLASTKIGSSGRAIGVDINDVRSYPATSVFSQHTADKVARRCSPAPKRSRPPAAARFPTSPSSKAISPLSLSQTVAVSDILAKKPLPDQLRKDVAMYVGCIAGAAEVADYQNWFREAGFKDSVITDTQADLNVYLDTNEDGAKKSGDCCGPVATVSACDGGDEAKKATPSCSSATTDSSDVGRTDLNEFVGSYKIFAVKD
ncbi:Putative arsenite S-adenosylmethyltransferase [Podospora comata]|uniref:Arsenite S-adenosylmethyltransferase n=1 Tax=Podospora comata TaxID=48703 RepID=A0ABY6SBT6_PODCO|nr:Putative arsenite S-adenosylmethyltransferase [Podospora comata]